MNKTPFKMAALWILSACQGYSTDLKIHASSPFIVWLCSHIGGDSVEVLASEDGEKEPNLAIYLHQSDVTSEDVVEIPRIILSDGLPLIFYPEDFAEVSELFFRELWLHPVQVIFLASSLSDILAEYSPENAEQFYEAFAQFSRSIRLEDFQIKRRFRGVEQPIALSREDARLMFPFLAHYNIGYTIEPEMNGSIFNTRQPVLGDSSVDTFVRLSDQLLKSE